MDIKKRIVIIGATSAIAEHCARLWVSQPAVDLTLVGRDPGRMESIAADLNVRNPQAIIRVMQANFIDPKSIQTVVDTIVAQGPVDIVLIAHGFLPTQADCQNNLQTCRDTLEINGISPMLYAEAFAKHMEQANYGTIAVIGSVAGDRGRKSNYVYGAAKALVANYAQGMQHRFAQTAVKVVLLKPGPTNRPMTAHLQGKGVKMASVEDVAQRIVLAIEQGQTISYAPAKWQVIMWLIRHLPNFVFNKINI